MPRRHFYSIAGLVTALTLCSFTSPAKADSHGLGACDSTSAEGFHFISAVQGSGPQTPMPNALVVVEGVVIGWRDNGFFLQEEKRDEDDNAQTSEGLFVVYNLDLPPVNSKVRLRASVVEADDMTQLTNVVAMQNCGTLAQDDAVPTTVPVRFPLSEGQDLEHFEGMLVSVTELTVFDTATLWRYGELGLSTSAKPNPTDLYAPLTSDYHAQVEANAASIVYVEDETSKRFPNSLSFFTNFSYANPIRIGDKVSASGPLNFAAGHYRINATKNNFAIANQRNEVPVLKDGNLSIAAFNVLNYFNGADDGNGGVTFDYRGNRGAKNASAFALQEARIVKAIVGMDADLVGLMEIENDGFGADSAIQALINALNQELDTPDQYRFIATSDNSQIGTDSIAVGIIYRPAVLTPTGEAIKIPMPSQQLVDPDRFARMRVSLLQSFTHNASQQGFAVAVNHFKSKGSGCYEDAVETRQIDSIQGRCNALRVSAAVTLGEALQNADLPDRVMILGDLNAYSAEDPLAVLTAYSPETRGYTIQTAVRTGLDDGKSVPVTKTYGFENVGKRYDAGGFSYWFYGDKQTGSLDHVLANPAFMTDIVDAAHWNINSIEAYQLQYDQALRFFPDEKGYAFSDVGPYRNSDHDPLIVSVKFPVSGSPAPDTDEQEPDQSVDEESGGALSWLWYLLMLIAIASKGARPVFYSAPSR